MRSRKGITLISLVVTIIILIILAGVSINIVLGENGLITKAKGAALDAKLSRHYEDIEMEIAAAMAEYYVGNSNTFSDILIQLLEQKGYSVDSEIGIDEKGTLTIVTDDGYKIIINVDNNGPQAIIDEEVSGNVDYDASITYDANAIDAIGTMNVQPAKTGEKAKLKSGTFTRTGYAIIGWSLTSDGEIIENNIINNVTGDITVYAIWAEAYTISFDPNGGIGTMEQLDVVKGNTVKLPANKFEKEGNVFTGWKVESTSYTDSQEVTVNSDMIFVAQWSDINHVTIGTADLVNYYGELVYNYMPSKGSGWRLFYADAENVYLISDNIGNQIVGHDDTSIKEPGKSLASTFDNWSSESQGITAAKWLLNTDNWKEYCDISGMNGEKIANWAIGGSSLELFAASFNATHDTKIVVTASDTGYLVNGSNKLKDIGTESILDNSIYFAPSYNYRLAAPVTYNVGSGVNCLMEARGVNDGNGLDLHYADNEQSQGIRPIVSIPRNNLSITSNGTLSILTGSGDDISEWLDCIGNNNDNNYTINSISELFSNKNLMNSLLSSEKAMKYLCNSTQKILPKLKEYIVFTKDEDLLKLIVDDKKLMNLLEIEEFSQPTLTSNSTETNDGTISVTSSHSAGGTREAYYAFRNSVTNNTGNNFYCVGNTTENAWLQIVYPYDIFITGIEFHTRAPSQSNAVITAYVGDKETIIGESITTVANLLAKYSMTTHKQLTNTVYFTFTDHPAWFGIQNVQIKGYIIR